MPIILVPLHVVVTVIEYNRRIGTGLDERHNGKM